VIAPLCVKCSCRLRLNLGLAGFLADPTRRCQRSGPTVFFVLRYCPTLGRPWLGRPVVGTLASNRPIGAPLRAGPAAADHRTARTWAQS